MSAASMPEHARLVSAFATARVAAATLWLPVLVPLVTGMLRGSGHGQTSYWLCLPLVPGTLASQLLQLVDASFFVVAGLVTLLVFAGLWWGLHRLAAPWNRALQVVAALTVAFEAIGFANALRA